MKFEVGRFYRTRNGSKVRFNGVNRAFFWFFEFELIEGGDAYVANSKMSPGETYITDARGGQIGLGSKMDVVGPWIEEQEKKEVE